MGGLKMENTFKKLNEIELGSQVKAIQGNRYLPWNVAWAELCKIHPKASYEFLENKDGLPYFESELGIFVKVSVTILETTHTMTRPVYDFRNLAMSSKPRQVKYGKKMVDVNAATANDINDSLMRCLTKAIAMHGLGLYIFQDKQYADAPLLDSTELTQITSLISERNLSLGELNKAFNINKLTELYAVNFESALQWIEDNSK